MRKIKELLSLQCDLEVPQQRIFLNGALLGNDTRTLEGYGIHANSPILTLEMHDGANAGSRAVGNDFFLTAVRLASSEGGQSLNIPVKPSFTVGKVKELIAANHGVDVSKQRLYFKGSLLGNDARTMEASGINASSTGLTLEIGDGAGAGMKWVLSSNSTGRNREIPLTIEHHLVFDNLTETNESDGNEMCAVVSRSMRANLSMTMHLSSTIGEIKEVLFETESVPIASQRLFYCHEELLDDDATLEECGLIFPNSVIVLELDAYEARAAGADSRIGSWYH